MRTSLFAVLIAAFAVTTLPFGSDDDSDCDDCASHGSTDSCCPESKGHAHGDQDDRHDGPDSPCSHEKNYHCCCGHVQAMIGMAASDVMPAFVSRRIVVANRCVRIDPSQRRTFHIPIA